jgi:two-component system, NarL family, nitrate/nitrite response regulator NarL
LQSCLIADDHAMMREALAGLVATGWPDAAIMLASDFPSCWQAASAAPDLVLCDLGMPGAAPVEGIAAVKDAAPHAKLLVVTAIEEDVVLLRLLDLGVDGFTPKSSPSRLIEAAIQLILAGGRYLPPRVADLLRGERQFSPADPNMLAVARLTERQIEVLQRVAQGQSNKEVARDLDLSPATVKAHIAAAFGALGAANRTEAVVKARSFGLI